MTTAAPVIRRRAAKTENDISPPVTKVGRVYVVRGHLPVSPHRPEPVQVTNNLRESLMGVRDASVMIRGGSGTKRGGRFSPAS